MSRAAFTVDATPLLVAPRPLPTDPTWSTCTAAIAEHGAGLVFVLEHPAEASPPAPPTPPAAAADVIGVLTDGGARRLRMPNVARALSEAQHPGARCAGRRLRVT